MKKTQDQKRIATRQFARELSEEEMKKLAGGCVVPSGATSGATGEDCAYSH